jgi:tetratricopeptide (TPR) repeat protein
MLCLPFLMQSIQHICKRRICNLRIYNRRIQASAFLLLLLAFLPFENLAAQNGSPSFEEVAAEAAAARDANDIPRAIELYTQGLRLDAKWHDGWWYLGLLQYESGAYAAATDALSHLLALRPDAGQALALRGLCEFETGDYSPALADIRKSLALGAGDDARHEQLLLYHEAMLLTRLGRFTEALRAYSAFAEHKLSSPELLVAIGLAALRMPLLPKEASADQQALLTSVGDATFEFMEGDQGAARLAFSDVFQRFPTARNAHLHYGILLLAFGQDAAEPQFKKELEVAPENADARIMLAWSLLMQNRGDEALPYATRIAQEEPERAIAQLALGRALVDTGNVAAGIEHLQHGIKLQPDNLEIHIALAKAYSKSGRDADARRERALCLQMTQNGATPLVHP